MNVLVSTLSVLIPVSVVVIVVLVDCGVALECGPEEDCANRSATETTPEFEIITETDPTPTLKSLSMLSEDEHHDMIFQPTVPPTYTNSNNASDDHKGRALDLSVGPGHNNKITKSTSSGKVKDLSDVSMDDEDGEEFIHNTASEKNMTSFGICVLGGLTYENGEKLENGCDSICTCENGKMDCAEKCTGPYIKKGARISDPLCREKESDDPCCSILVCTADTETEPLEMCSYKNKTYHRSEKFEDGCESICICNAGGKINCKPRCPETKNKTTDRCVEVPDHLDSCCTKLLCDVTLDDNESEKEDDKLHPRILLASLVNATTVKIKFNPDLEEKGNLPEIQLSNDKVSWKTYKLQPGGFLSGFDPDSKFVKIHGSSEITEIEDDPHQELHDVATSCEYKGKLYKLGDEFNDNCTSFCVCRENGVQCLKLECPTYFGVDVLDPACVEWETVPANFVPSPPNCCPKEVRCKNNGSCTYEGMEFSNWQELPSNVTGCEKKCYCELGKVDCLNVCPPVTAFPPSNIECPASEATLSHLPQDDCCLFWVCNSTNADNVLTGPGENTTKEIGSGDDNNHISHLGSVNIWPTKPPSKTSGPLLVYANKDSDKDIVFGVHLPSIKKEENHFYNKSFSVTNKHPDKNQNVSKVPPAYFGPFNPNYKVDVGIKQNKASGTKYKPNKESTIKDLNSSPFDVEKQTDIITDTKVKRPNPDLVKHTTAKTKLPIPEEMDVYSAQPPISSQPPLHDNSHSDEVLQFINQHPELANYPPGSVFEIHSVPVVGQQKPAKSQYSNPNILIPPTNDHSIIPVVVNQDQQTMRVPDISPQGIDLDQFLQQIHRPSLHQNYFQYPSHSSNGVFVAASNGQTIPVRTDLNNTISGQTFPGFPNLPPPGVHRNQDEIVVHSVEAVDAHTIRLAFSVPSIIVGLHGRVEVRYTSKLNDDIANWSLQIFTPPEDYISTPQMEFDLLGLESNTEYKIKVTVVLRGLHNTPTSQIYNVRTPKETSTTLPPMIPIEPKLEIVDINSTWVTVTWRKFTDHELQFIDGVQLRYKEIDGKIYQATPLIHRMVTTYTLDNLKPNTKYEIGIFFIPFPSQNTELHAEHMLHFTTANEVDTYGFNVTLEITNIKATSVEITWYGVPYPQDKYVNIYRAIYQSDSGKGDSSTFKIAKRDSTPKTIIKDLKPRTKYRLWLEVYLTNGKIKTSNVKDFATKASAYPSLAQSAHQEMWERDALSNQNDNSYYGPLVVVAIIAAIAIVSTVVLLMMLLRRHGQHKASITTPPQRVSQSAYDNPTYKVEIQQETMDL